MRAGEGLARGSGVGGSWRGEPGPRSPTWDPGGSGAPWMGWVLLERRGTETRAGESEAGPGLLNTLPGAPGLGEASSHL